MTFAEFIEMKYLAWREDKRGRKGSASKYAQQELGVTSQLLSEWMNRGKVPTERQYINLLYAKFGDEIFEFLPTDAQLQPIAELILLFPPEERPAVREQIMSTIRDLLEKSKNKA